MGKGTCAVPDCERTVRSSSYCDSHYARLRRYGDVQADVPLGYRSPRGSWPRCKVEDCLGRARALKLCTLHYQRWAAHGTLDLPSRPLKRDSGDFKHGSAQGYNFHKCRCGECVGWRTAYMTARAEQDPDEPRRGHLARYGLTVTDYKAMSEAQGNACAVCRLPERPGRKRNLAVDHCHTTGQVRGLLCHNCNVAAGQLMDDPALVDALAAYLRKSVA